MSLVTPTSTITVLGAKSRSTVMCGIRTRWTSVGHPTATATGIGSAPGAGPGLTMLLGALLPSTMAAGPWWAALGVGARDRCSHVHSTDRHLSALSAGELASALVAASVAASVGSRWASANRSIPGITTAETISAT